MNVHYLRVQDGDPFPTLDDLCPFKAVIVIEGVVSPQWQTTASRWLVGTRCRYMMAWGNDCSSWDNSISLANLEQFEYGEIPDDDFIMTTWHDDEPLQDVVWHAKHLANHPTIKLEKVLFLHIGASDRQSEFGDLYRSA